MLLRRTVLAVVFVSARIAASASTACSDPDCTVSATSRSCEWAADHVRSCADLETGIYGTASYSCAAHCNADNQTGCYGGVITATDAAGHVTTTPFAEGFYAARLSPGTYDVCGSVQGTKPICTSITLVKTVRVDIASAASPGGIYPSLVVDGRKVGS